MASKSFATHNWRIWWQLARPHTLTAGFIPVATGTALALKEGKFLFLPFSAMLFASLLIQAATNIFNEYYDYKRGLDNENSVGIGGTIVYHGVSPKIIINIAICLYLIAGLIGFYICYISSWYLIFVGLVSMLVGFLYTGGPLPIAYTPFGEMFAGFFMGYLIIAISYFIQTNVILTTNWLVTVPISLLIANILLANNIRDLDNDALAGRRTIAIIIGKRYAVYLLGTIFATAYIIIIFLSIFGVTSLLPLLVFISIPKAVSATKGFVGKENPQEMMPAMIATAKTNTLFGLILTASLIIESLIF